jgi:putative protease
MIEHIPEMVESGIVSFKIEGRMKGINYLASAVKVYREAIDDYSKNPAGYGVKKDWLEELGRISHRSYCTGFYFDDPDQISPAYEGKKNGGLTFIGKITDNIEQHSVNIEVRNKIFKGDVIEVLRRKRPSRQDKINGILDQDGQSISFAQPGSKVTIALNDSYAPNDLIRRAETT